MSVALCLRQKIPVLFRSHYKISQNFVTTAGKNSFMVVVNRNLTTTTVRNKIIQKKLFEKSFSDILARSFNTIKSTMEKHCVVPDVVSVVPKATLEVNYKSGVKADFGNELKPRQVKDQPEVKWESCSDTYYTLCKTDPDAPSRKDPTYREWHHWLVGNIPGNDISKGDELSAYIGAGPPEGTGLHRYIFLLYKQPGKLNFDEKRLPNNSGDGRGCFKISSFAKKYNLGDPIAGNLYQAEWDDYVPELYKQLGA